MGRTPECAVADRPERRDDGAAGSEVVPGPRGPGAGAVTGGTRHDRRHAAEICRENGWGVGTSLIGDAGLGPTVIRITGLGERVMLARMLSHAGRAVGYHEPQSWSLGLRDWCRIAR